MENEKTKIFYTQINDIIEYSKNCTPWLTTFAIKSSNSKTKTNALNKLFYAIQFKKR